MDDEAASRGVDEGADRGLGDAAAFAALAEPHRRELRVHCYRLLGSFEEAEDLVQETFLRAWQHRASSQGPATFRAWLYRIATNACLDFLARRPRRPRPGWRGPAAIPWLQPFPDRLLEPIAPGEAGPEAAATDRETLELAYMAAIQHLPPRQRAVLILRDILGWSAKETAALLDLSVAATNSALQRARAALRTHLPARRLEWSPAATPTAEEQATLRRYMEATERHDLAALAALLREDARAIHQPRSGGHTLPEPALYAGRAAILATWSPALQGPDALPFRLLPTRANGQPATAAYIRAPGEAVYRPFGLDVLRIERGEVVEVVAFSPALFPAFGLPARLDPSPR